jgi:hypothetical protein
MHGFVKGMLHDFAWNLKKMKITIVVVKVVGYINFL